ncbi:hypothetical protein CPB84DRAFT_823791 [Gymnopilus junonius]|uniref:Uncharacterized protein n=1 Tax=Gymnopilus junonius TaxID=109634 RepID=A0A9P5TNC7_GYMJU|nr:hypothetical protein CPB84DRAFT_823791 [Gymnopilus junonius]
MLTHALFYSLHSHYPRHYFLYHSFMFTMHPSSMSFSSLGLCVLLSPSSVDNCAFSLFYLFAFLASICITHHPFFITLHSLSSTSSHHLPILSTLDL